MWIKTQEKNTLINVIEVTALKVATGKRKGIIQGHFAGGTSLLPNSIVLGQYATYESALKEIENIEEAINNHPNKVYQIG